MLNYLETEEWREIVLDDKVHESEKGKLMISSFGRVKSFKVNKKKGRLIKGGLTGKYLTISIKTVENIKRNRYIHRLVAETFFPKRNDNQNIIIHIDYNHTNNKASNLSWASTAEKAKHQAKGPNRVKTNAKLTETKVRLIKKKINDPKRKTRMKILAKRYGVSEMQLYRIKSGENWGHVK